MKRVWKPLDVGGLRLYEVTQQFHWKDGDIEAKMHLAVAKSPSQAAELVERCYKDTEWRPEITNVNYFGKAVNVLMPRSWWEEGVPCCLTP